MRFVFPYHPAYGLTNSIRERAVRLVLLEGCTATEAARLTKVSDVAVRRWVREVKVHTD